MHWNGNAVILTKSSSLASKFVKMTSFGAIGDEKFYKSYHSENVAAYTTEESSHWSELNEEIIIPWAHFCTYFLLCQM